MRKAHESAVDSNGHAHFASMPAFARLAVSAQLTSAATEA